MVVNLQFFGGVAVLVDWVADVEIRGEAHAADAEEGKVFNGRQRSE